VLLITRWPESSRLTVNLEGGAIVDITMPDVAIPVILRT
jgi:hypothetical protein